MRFEPQAEGLPPSLVVENSLGGRPQPTKTRLARRNPSCRGDIATIVPQSNADDVADVLSRASDSSARFASALLTSERGWLFHFAGLLEVHAQELAGFAARELGQTKRDLRADLVGTAEVLRWLHAACGADSRIGLGFGPERDYFAARRPAGTVLLVRPGPLDPASETLSRIVTSLALGNVVVAQPSVECSGTVALLVELLAKAKAPLERLFVVYGDETTAEFLREMSDRAGILQGAAPIFPANTQRVCPTIVLADADLSLAVRSSVVAALRGTGQANDSSHHLVVDRRVSSAFREELTRRVLALEPGDARVESTVLGPVLNEPLLRAWNELRGLGVSEGAELLVDGGRVGEDGDYSRDDTRELALYARPRVFARVNPTMELASQVGRGPTLLLLEVDGLTDALAAATALGSLGEVRLFSRDARVVTEANSQVRARATILNPTLDLQAAAVRRGHAAALETLACGTCWSLVESNFSSGTGELALEAHEAQHSILPLWPALGS